jgi:hypothetical protein
MPTSNSQLEQVRSLIREGKKKQAVSQLATLIERDHDNPELWWLLANATPDYHQARRALEEMLSLKPDDARAQKMLDRLETRQLLRQMGVAGEPAPRSSSRRRILMFALGGLTGVIILLGAAIGLTQLNRPINSELPTAVAFATEEPTVEATPTEEATVIVVTEEPITEPTQIAPETTGEAVAMVTTDETVVTQEPTPQATLDFGVGLRSTEQVTVEIIPPTLDPLALPETTQEAAPLPIGDGASTTSALPFSPESTQDPIPQENVAPVQQAERELPNTVAAVEPVTDIRGQVLDGQARRDIIAAYGVQGWTFSGYRGENIKLELKNMTGNGNPSLELRNEAGQVVMSDIDTTSGNNTDSLLEVTLPSDGIYTVVVRMASLEEQLYSLKLTRVQ